MTTPARRQSSELRAGYVIGRLDHVVSKELRGRLTDFNLSLNAYTTLSVLRERPGLSNAQLARRAMVTPQAMNQIVASLLDQDLIERRTDPNHQRILQTRPTENGLRVLGRCDVVTDELEERMLAGIDHVDRDALLTLLRICVRNLGAGL